MIRAGVRYLLSPALFPLSFVVPRTETLWVFGSSGGEAFADNSKYLYLYAAAERGHVRAVWLSTNDDVITDLQERGYEAYDANSLRGMWLNLRAAYAFVTHGMPDVNRWCSGGATTVVLWHGVALKRIGWDGYKRRRPMERVKGHLKDAIVDRFDWVTVTSEAMIEPFASAFRMDSDRILVTGYPRNDVLTGVVPAYRSPRSDELDDRYRELHEESAVFLYVPTHRPETDRRVADQLRPSELDDWLRERDAHLLLKPHPAEPIDLGDEGFSRIHEVPGEIDVYPLLKHTDALITDYSSIYFDYLHLDRPVVFFPFDLEQYRSTRGFYLDYEAVTPGPMAFDFDGLLSRMETVLGDDEFAEERRSVRETYLRTSDGGRCEAVCDRFDPRVTVETGDPTTRAVIENDARSS